MVADQELNASVGKWAKQSEDANGNPLVMVVLAHDLRLCLAQWPASEKRYEPGVLRESTGAILERYPGLRLLTMDALAEPNLCQAIVGHGRDIGQRDAPSVLGTPDGFAGEESPPQAQTLEKKPS